MKNVYSDIETIFDNFIFEAEELISYMDMENIYNKKAAKLKKFVSRTKSLYENLMNPEKWEFSGDWDEYFENIDQ